MASFQVTVKGLDELRTKIKMIGDGMGDILEEAVHSGATVVEKEAKRNSKRGGAFPHRRTGTLFDSINSVLVSKSKNRVEFAVGSAMVHARTQELGATITAKRARFLRFQTPDGKWHRVKTVHIPPRPFLRPALDDNQDKVEAEIQKRLMLLIGRHAK